MKTIITSLLLALLTVATTTVGAQDWPEEYLGLPGDNLNLYAVMKLFQESETLEEFERNLNDENSRINNLDLNGNNLVDYIMVVDYQDGNVHNIVLRVALDRNEYQDVAVFIVEQNRNGSVTVQLIGDEALYGKNYIVEPYYAGNAEETPNPAYIGRVERPVAANRTVHVEIHTWPVVRYIYHPGYVVWRSAWHWDIRPVWWNPWRPYYWHYYYGYHYHWRPYYTRYYRVTNHFHYTRYNDFYITSVRTYSPRVTVNIKQGNYRTTYSRPDMRREGEALYSRTHADRQSRTSGRETINDQGRRSASSSARYSPTENAGSVSGRRTNTEAPERRSESVGRSSERQIQSTERRASGNTSARTRTEASPVRNNPASERSGVVTARPAERNTEVQRTETMRRASPATNNETIRGNASPSGNNAGSRISGQGSATRGSAARTATQPAVKSASSGNTPEARPASSDRNSGYSAPASVNRNSATRSNTPTTVGRSSSGNENRNSVPAVRRSSSENNRSSAPAVNRSSSSGSNRSSAPAVERSSSNRSSTPAVSRSSSSGNSRSSAPAVSKGSSGNSSKSSSSAGNSNESPSGRSRR